MIDEERMLWREYIVKRDTLRASRFGGTDNTVTPQFVDSLYKEEICFYCNRNIRDRNRTVDHKTPISRFGKQSVHNLVMACQACNVQKGSMTAEEFFDIRKRVTKINGGCNLAGIKKYTKKVDRVIHKQMALLNRLQAPTKI